MSSDSDFYHIATFLRTHGKKVICYGEKHTPNMLKNVCDESQRSEMCNTFQVPNYNLQHYLAKQCL